MDCVRLTPEQRREFDDNGFLVVKNALTSAEVARLLATCDRMMDTFLHWTNDEIHQIRKRVVHERPLFELVAKSSTVPLVVQLLGPNIHLQSAGVIYKKPRPGAEPHARGWHRDIGITSDLGHDKLPLVGIKVCYCLTDFPAPDTGITKVVPGSHRAKEPLTIPRGALHPPGAHDLELEAGDAFLFENRLYHTASRNFGDRVSKVVMYGYAYRWMKPDHNLDVPDDAVLRQADPVRWQLLGGYRSVEAVPRAMLDWAKAHDVFPTRIPWTVEAESGTPREYIPRY